MNKKRMSTNGLILSSILILFLLTSPGFSQLQKMPPFCVNICSCSANCSTSCRLDPLDPIVITCGEWGGVCNGGQSCPPSCSTCSYSSSCSTICRDDQGGNSTCGDEGVCNQCPSASPPSACPATTCPANLSGWTNMYPFCSNVEPYGSVEDCLLWCNQATGDFCTQVSTCATE